MKKMYKFLVLSMALVLLLASSFVNAREKKYTTCSELLKSIAYPTEADALRLRRNLLIANGTTSAILQTGKLIMTAGLGITGLPISIGFSLLYQGLKYARLTIGENSRQMIAVIIVSEALVNDDIDVNGDFGRADLMIFEHFLSAKREFLKYVRRRQKKIYGRSSDRILKKISNIEFANLVVDVEKFSGIVDYENGSSEFVIGDEFYCKKKRNVTVRFKGFGRKTRAFLYKYYSTRKP